MSNTTTLYEKCIHDRLEAHTVCTGEFGHDDACIHKGCPGGRERTFEFLDECCTRCGSECDDHATGIWVEVSDE